MTIIIIIITYFIIVVRYSYHDYSYDMFVNVFIYSLTHMYINIYVHTFIYSYMNKVKSGTEVLGIEEPE